ncbi:MAG: damage-inducible protein CinA [Planctomycetaceae bacterium]|nr:damage-inducible protein CinA [Planctomycetaceae bacterium]
MSAEVIAIGSELTCGSKLDTNSQWLSRELEALGWTVTRHTALADDMAAMTAEFREAATRSRVVMITGGLGPTLDDITRDALAAAFGQALITDEQALEQIKALFAARGREMPNRNHRQAQRPESAQMIQNFCGTAPGLIMRIEPDAEGLVHPDGCLIAVMPGVPAEMKPMFEQQVRPNLVASNTVITRKVIRSFGFGESDVEKMLGELTARGRNPEVGITASEAVISLWITARAEDAMTSQRLAEDVRAEILEHLGDAIYTEGDLELHQVVGNLLVQHGKRVACVEGSTTGGLIAHWFTEEHAHAKCLASASIYADLNFLKSIVDAGPSETSGQSFAMLAEQAASHLLATGAADCVLLSSPHTDESTNTGIRMKRGEVAVADANSFEVFDVSMTGNLAIFRQRAGRTAINRLRLILR